jgi:putative ABC transport system permease protein
MTPLFRLAARSLWNRRGTAALTVFAIAVSVALLLGVQQVRTQARESFANTISGTDLVVGARSGPLNLLLYSVFRVGDATANVTWPTYQKVAGHRDVAWTIPLSLGDSHRGFRVLGTNNDYFAHYRYGRKQPLQFAAGKPFGGLYDAVLGAEVAEALDYKLGDPIVVAHGLGEVSFANHDKQPMRVAGILARTGTPVDRTVHVSLEAITAIHLDWQGGVPPPPGAQITAEQAQAQQLTPQSITAFLVGMKDRTTIFIMQRALNEYRGEALSAILPGVALQQLWSLVGVADTALLVVAGFVVLAGLLGMLTALLTSLNERRREMAILRSVGARPAQVFALLVSEATLLAFTGAVVGLLFTLGGLALLQPWIEARYGLSLALGAPSPLEWALLGGVVASGALIGLVPAWRAYRHSLADGLTVRV